MTEITADDIDWDRVAACRHAAMRSNPIVGHIRECVGSTVKTSVIRLRDLPKKMRKRYDRNKGELR